MKCLTRDQILAAEDLPRKLVEVPEWGGSVYVRHLTAQERVEWASQADAPKGHTIASLLVLCLVDADGHHVFTKDDIPKLLEKNGVVVDRLAGEVIELNGLRARDEERILKNSGAGPSAGSTSE
jgi:hypothetical protein